MLLDCRIHDRDTLTTNSAKDTPPLLDACTRFLARRLSRSFDHDGVLAYTILDLTQPFHSPIHVL